MMDSITHSIISAPPQNLISFRDAPRTREVFITTEKKPIDRNGVTKKRYRSAMYTTPGLKCRNGMSKNNAVSGKNGGVFGL